MNKRNAHRLLLPNPWLVVIALLPWAAAITSSTLTVGCQPVLEMGDAEATLEAFEAAISAATDATSTHGAAIDEAADQEALLAEEASFAQGSRAIFDEIQVSAREIAECVGADQHDAEPMPEDVHAMFEALLITVDEHEAAMSSADEADQQGVEDAFQAEVTLHASHGMDLHDAMHEHLEMDEFSCPPTHEE